MPAIETLISYYQSDAETCVKILNDKQSLIDLLEQRCLLILLRYIESITHLEIQLTIKTLLLAVRLLKVSPSKMKNMLCSLQIRISNNPNIRASKDMSLIRCLLQKLENYYNYLIKNEVSSRFPERKELEILTANLLKLSQSSFSKEKDLVKFCEFAYWMAQDELFQLWNQINSEIQLFQGYEIKQFHQFYQKYTHFCTFRRKIPKLKHKKLKDVIVKSDLNTKIEAKWKETAKKVQLQADSVGQKSECLIKCVNLQRLAISEDFQ